MAKKPDPELPLPRQSPETAEQLRKESDERLRKQQEEQKKNQEDNGSK